MANLTIYQRLSKLFGPAGPTSTEPTYQKFNIGSDEILKTDSKKEIKADPNSPFAVLEKLL